MTTEVKFTHNGIGTKASLFCRKKGDISQIGLKRNAFARPGHLLRPKGAAAFTPADALPGNYEQFLESPSLVDGEGNAMVALGLYSVSPDMTGLRIGHKPTPKEVKDCQAALIPRGRVTKAMFLNPADDRRQGSLPELLEGTMSRLEYFKARLDNIFTNLIADDVVRGAGSERALDEGGSMVEGVGVYGPPSNWALVKLNVFLRMESLCDNDSDKLAVQEAMIGVHGEALGDAIFNYKWARSAFADFESLQAITAIENPIEEKQNLKYVSKRVGTYVFRVFAIKDTEFKGEETKIAVKGLDGTPDIFQGEKVDKEGDIWSEESDGPKYFVHNDRTGTVVAEVAGNVSTFTFTPEEVIGATAFKFHEVFSIDCEEDGDTCIVFECVNANIESDGEAADNDFAEIFSMLNYAAHAQMSANGVGGALKAQFALARTQGFFDRDYFGSTEVLDQNAYFIREVNSELFSELEAFLGDDSLYEVLRCFTSVSRIRGGHTVAMANGPRHVLKLLKAVGIDENRREAEVAELIAVIAYAGYHYIPFREERLRVISRIQTGDLSFAISRRMFTYGPGEMAYHMLALFLQSLDDAKFFQLTNLQDRYTEFLSVYEKWSATSWMETPYADYLYGKSKNEDTVSRRVMDKMWGYAVSASAAMPKGTISRAVSFQRDAEQKGGNTIMGPAAVEGFAQAIRGHYRTMVGTSVAKLTLK
jgi:hypothetical protein